MNGPVSGPKQAAVSLPRILIAKVASHCSGFRAQWEGVGQYTFSLSVSPLCLCNSVCVIPSLFYPFKSLSVSHTTPPPRFFSQNAAEIAALNENLIKFTLTPCLIIHNLAIGICGYKNNEWLT